METIQEYMKFFKTSFFAGFAFLIAASSITPLSANAVSTREQLQQQTQQRTVVKTESNGCRRYSDGSIDCRR